MFILHSKPWIDEEDKLSVDEVLNSRFLARGQKVDEFEKNLASFFNVKGVVAVESGTAALHLALLAIGVRKNEEVILPSYVCSSVLNAINYVGAKPILVDINPEDFNPDISEIFKKVTNKTKAIIVPHLFGLPTDMNELRELPVPIIEDCAHSIGATYHGMKTGGIGDLSIFSFYPTKMMTTGKGGAVASNNVSYLFKIRDLISVDKRPRYSVRYNYGMTDFQASLGLSQLKKLPFFILRRKCIASIYNNAYREIGIQLPIFPEGRDHIYYRYAIRLRDEQRLNKITLLCAKLNESGIEVKRDPVFRPLHMYMRLKGFPRTEKVEKSVVSIPIYPALSDNEIDYIVSNFIKILKRPSVF